MKYPGIEITIFLVPESKSLSGMERTEESFVPFLNNVNLHNTTQGFLFLFLKRVSSQYISSTLTQFLKKELKMWKTIILYIKHQYI